MKLSKLLKGLVRAAPVIIAVAPEAYRVGKQVRKATKKKKKPTEAAGQQD